MCNYSANYVLHVVQCSMRGRNQTNLPKFNKFQQGSGDGSLITLR